MYGKYVSTNRLLQHKLKKYNTNKILLEYTEKLQIKNEIFYNINEKDLILQRLTCHKY